MLCPTEALKEKPTRQTRIDAKIKIHFVHFPDKSFKVIQWNHMSNYRRIKNQSRRNVTATINRKFH